MNTTDILSRFIFREDAKLLFEPKAGLQHSLNDTAVLIIKKLLTGLTVDETARFLSDKYGISSDEIKTDINELLAELHSPHPDTFPDEPEKSTDVIPDFPFAIEVELTQLCNLSCIFCYNAQVAGIKRTQLPPHLDTERLFEIFQECKLNNLLRVRYSGGEPTLHPNFSKILANGCDCGFYQVVFTNGRTLRKPSVAKLWHSLNVKEVLISLHGGQVSHEELTRKKGSYWKTLKAIENSLHGGIETVVEMTLVSANIADIIPTIETVKSMGVKEFRIMRYVPRGIEDHKLAIPIQAIAELIKKLEAFSGINIRFPCSQKFCLTDGAVPITNERMAKQRGKYLNQHCQAGITWLSISHDAKLRICPHSSIFAADVSKSGQSLKTAWENNLKKPLIRALDRQSEECDDCLSWQLCRGGCYLNQARAILSCAGFK